MISGRDYICDNCGQGHTDSGDVYTDIGQCVACVDQFEADERGECGDE